MASGNRRSVQPGRRHVVQGHRHRKASDLWTLTGSYWFIETPIPTQTQAPNLMESDINMWSVGAKRSFGRKALGLSFTLMDYEKRVITDNIVPAYNGFYDTTANIYQLTYSYAFD